MTENYIFESKEVYAQSIIHLLNVYFEEEIIGAEVGVGAAQSLCTLLQQCPKIKTMYAIDSYKPYVNFLKQEYDGIPANTTDEKQAEGVQWTAHHNVKYSGHKDKVIFIQEESIDAAKQIEDNSLDFIFLDAHSTPDQVLEDINAWYPKIKTGGIISGHDWVSRQVRYAVQKFMVDNKIENAVSTFDNVWLWKKS
jgi:hypothetical protein